MGDWITHQEALELSVVGDDAVVDDDELAGGIRALRVGVDVRGRSVGGPPGVRNADVVAEGLVPVNLEG